MPEHEPSQRGPREGPLLLCMKGTYMEDMNEVWRSIEAHLQAASVASGSPIAPDDAHHPAAGRLPRSYFWQVLLLSWSYLRPHASCVRHAWVVCHSARQSSPSTERDSAAEQWLSAVGCLLCPATHVAVDLRMNLLQQCSPCQDCHGLSPQARYPAPRWTVPFNPVFARLHSGTPLSCRACGASEPPHTQKW